ncbi:Uncharacterised protein [Raoultella terrigena]|uniref:Uncharacterized protein n=1 Tax=Raoultella terrigena TaxID=577 RepID=A0A4U9D7Q2_RAOTE|nr:Uncharacterised protein [Raoultella terrigena]
MKKALLWLLIATLPAHAAMDITRELDAPALLVPGQPVRVAVTYWTDSWFNPPPEWPDFAVKNGELLSTPLPSQLVTRKKNGISWSGIRLERQAAAWEQGTLRLPAVDVTVASASQGPVNRAPSGAGKARKMAGGHHPGRPFFTRQSADDDAGYSPVPRR